GWERNEPEGAQRFMVGEQARPQLISQPHSRRRHREEYKPAPPEGRGEEQQQGPGQAVGETLSDVAGGAREARAAVPSQAVSEAAREAQRSRMMIDRMRQERHPPNRLRGPL